MNRIWTLLREIAWLPVFAVVASLLAVARAFSVPYPGNEVVALGALAVTLAVLNLRA